MKASIRFFCWLLVGAMFCAVSFGGCGGSDNLASVNVQDEQTSGDSSSGRGDGFDYVDLTFETNIPGKWRIVDTVMELGTGEVLFSTVDVEDLSVTDFQLTVDGNTMSIYDSNGQYYLAVRNSFSGDDDMGRELNATDIPILVSGKYYATSTNNQYRHYVNYATENYQDYCILEGRRKEGSTSSQWTSLTSTFVHIAGDHKVITILDPISDMIDDFEIID